MTKRMLIDARHSEETRIAIIDDFKLEEFDFESTQKLPLKGNIYLAKVVRVEPSLQAAFVDYGGGRHGFLAFNEIHPDYFRIPVSDREKLEELERTSSAVFEEEKEDSAPKLKKKKSTSLASEENEEFLKVIDTSDDSQNFEETFSSSSDPLEGEDNDIDSARHMQSSRIFHKKYKIQEVIKSRQILLIQVVKEERGTKGAALTTYISLAGRYCVLMPNALKGGGISRKITDSQTRKRLRSLLEDLDLPLTMGVIVRTAGMEKTKLEIKRDLDYLLKLWNDIRELTLKSSAPSLIYREGDLIKRTLRDFYSKDIEEIIVEGEEAYRNAKDFMRLLMPSHAKRIRSYKDDTNPLFRKFKVEDQIDEMHDPVVQLRSGGYIVINHTEALTAIDVNSGRSNRERHIDETALRTNLEAAEETARQIRLRDLAGLIVIDFIDMSDPRHNAAVERRLRESMREDRARTQLGRISPFGLLELSRQRLRPNLLEASSIPCVHCRGTGLVRSTESVALHILRSLEENLQPVEEKSLVEESILLTIHASKSVVSYLLNQKRMHLLDLETRFHLKILILEDDILLASDFRVASPYHSSDSTKSPEAARKEVRRRSHQKVENLSQVISSEENTEGEDPSRPSFRKKNRRNKNKLKNTRPPIVSSSSEADGSLEPTDIPESSSTQIPSSSDSAPSSEEKKPYKSRHRARRTFRRIKDSKETASPQEQNFAVMNHVSSEERTSLEETKSFPAKPFSSDTSASSPPSSENKPFRRRTRYPLNARNRQFKEKSGEKSSSFDMPPPPPPSSQNPPSPPKKTTSSQTSEEPRKGWWQRLLD